MNTVQIWVLIFLSPGIIYFCAKFGRYGWLKANQIFAEQNKTKNKD